MNKKIEDIAYIDILKKSWNITWTNRKLWWFGLFLALGGGMGNLNYSMDEENKKAGEEISRFISQHMELVIILGIFCAVLFIALFILSVIARSGIIISLEKLLKSKPFEFRSGMREGKKYFWKLFFLYLILGLLMVASLIILATPVTFLFLAKSYILGVMLAILAVIIFIPLVILATYLKTYGEIYIVTSNLSPWNTIETSYELFHKNLLTSIIMGLLFIPISIVIMLGMLITVAPLAILAIFLAFLGKIGISIAAIIGIIIFLAVLLVQSVFQTFHQTAWLLFFHEIATPPVEEKVEETVTEVEKEILPATGDAVKMADNDK